MKAVIRVAPNLDYLYGEVPPLERYAAAARSGFRGVEAAFPYAHSADEVAGRLQDNDLTLVQMIAPPLEPGSATSQACWPDRREAFRAAFERSMDYVAQVRPEMIHLVAGGLQPGANREACLDAFLENLAFAADCAAALGADVILEPVCRARWADFLFHRIEEGLAIVKTVGRPNVRLCFDTYHVQMEEGSLAQSFEAAWPHLGHIQVGDVPGRREPGTGEIDFAGFWVRLAKVGWDGWIGCEYVPSGDTERAFGWIADMIGRRS